MKKTLVLVFHPNLDQSRANIRLMNKAKSLEGVTVVDECAAHPDGTFDVEAERRLIADHDRIVFQFPIYWYSSPALFKQWEDSVLIAGSTMFEGKEIQLAVTTGSPEEAYQHDGYQGHTIEDILMPYGAIVGYLHGSYAKPFAVYGVASADDAALDEAAERYGELLAR